MQAKSIKGKSTEEIKAALTETIDGKFKPTLAIVFISVKQDREAISKLLDEKAFRYLVLPLQVNLLMVKLKKAALS